MLFHLNIWVSPTFPTKPMLRDKDNSSDEYSNILFDDLISLLKPKQKQIMFYKFYLQLSDIEIAKILIILRQAINKAERVAFKILRAELCKE
jgi:DNA-directed RNA polymerase specialized sigma subunit